MTIPALVAPVLPVAVLVLLTLVTPTLVALSLLIALALVAAVIGLLPLLALTVTVVVAHDPLLSARTHSVLVADINPTDLLKPPRLNSTDDFIMGGCPPDVLRLAHG